jgi:hypothetical protein
VIIWKETVVDTLDGTRLKTFSASSTAVGGSEIHEALTDFLRKTSEQILRSYGRASPNLCDGVILSFRPDSGSFIALPSVAAHFANGSKIQVVIDFSIIDEFYHDIILALEGSDFESAHSRLMDEWFSRLRAAGETGAGCDALRDLQANSFRLIGMQYDDLETDFPIWPTTR